MTEEHSELLYKLLEYASQVRATDLHICAGSTPLVRVNSRLARVPNFDMMLPPVIEQMARSLLNESQWETLQNKRTMDFSFSVSGMGRFRCNIYSQRGTFAIAIRALPFAIPAFDTLGLPKVIKSFTQKTRGLFLATGATGSGKSTTLASLIDMINRTYSYHILTIEDPVEYLHRHELSLLTQREVGYDCKSFASALRSALREDPDVIMVGEMRDPETIAIALTAAETGHLVFSSLHTVGAAKSIDRIIDSFPTNQQNQARMQLATVLEGVVSQQLIPRADGEGLALACEVMVVTPAIRNLIREGKHYQINSVMQTGGSQGMRLMDMDLARLCREGVISQENALLYAQDMQVFQQFYNRR